MTQSINGYDAILVKGTARFRHNRKMVPAADVPQEIQTALVEALVNEKLQAPANPIPVQAPVEVAPEAPMTLADFEQPVEDIAPEVVNTGVPTEFEMNLITELEAAKAKIAELESTPAVKQDLPSIAAELHKRYGIYTAFLGIPPTSGDVHPFTGKQMNRYEMGLAYQAYKQAKAAGYLNNNFDAQVEKIREATAARDVHQNEFAERRAGTYDDGFKTFAERTAPQFSAQKSTTTVKRNNDPISEDVTAEPNLRRQTIREQW